MTTVIFNNSNQNIVKRDENKKLFVLDPNNGLRCYFEENDEDGFLESCEKDIRNSNAIGLSSESNLDYKSFLGCIISENNQTLSQYISANDHKLIISNNMHNINPLLVKIILFRFGFKEFSKFDWITQTNLNQVESIDHWMTYSITEKFDSPVISQSIGLKNYLQFLVEYINSNPAILNKNI